MNYDLVSGSDRCSWRFTSLHLAAIACISMQNCGSIVRDRGLRCGEIGIKMHYEVRSSKTTRPPVTGFTSWVMVGPDAHGRCSKFPSLPPSLKLTPREQWLQGKQDDMSSIPVVQHAPVTVLISGTLRGFRKCIPALRETIITPNLPVQLVVATYDRNDCGGSAHTHGLGLTASPVHPNFWKAYEVNGVHPVVHIESHQHIDDIKKMHPRNIHPVFVRYHSQFFLRQHAMRTATESIVSDAERIFIVLRPDAYLYGRWRFYRISGQPNHTLASLSLRDGSVCNVTLTPSLLVVPWSDIHSELWDDTLAIGYGNAMRTYVNFHKMMPRLSWHISEKVEHKIEDYLNRHGVQITYACGAARGDMLKLVKSCDAKDK
jgi:hypothetical protein